MPCKTPSLLAVLTVLAILVLSCQSEAADKRCNGELMTRGTLMHKVLRHCGPPVAKYLVGEIQVTDSRLGKRYLYIEEWIYEEQGGYFILRFEGGRLEATEFEQD